MNQTDITSIVTDGAGSVISEITETTSFATIQEQVNRTAGILERALAYFSHAVPSLIMALAILIIGVLISRLIAGVFKKTLKKSNIDGAAKSFLVSLIKVILYMVVLIMALTVLNVPMSSVITIFGAAGLAVSLALQNCLSNLAGGFIILFSKPFVSGDIVELDGSVGKVITIGILYTKIESFDCKTIFIPNGKVTDAKIVNYTESPTRRIDLRFDISYTADYSKARDIILNIISSKKEIAASPEPLVRMAAHNESSVSIDVVVWVENNDYNEVRYALLEEVKAGFDENGIEIPFNQLDVYVKELNNGKLKKQ